jgi:putative transposase
MDRPLYIRYEECPLARQKRIEYPGAFYHITSRGNRKQTIFLSDDDRIFFLHCLRRACEKYGIVIQGYCLMDNHYHLFIETPWGNLSKAMHYLNTAYAIYFNKKHAYVGHPFQGRFKAVLVQAESYARDLVAYIHLNPVRARIVEGPERYPWSDYREYIGLSAPKPWTSHAMVLGQFGTSLAGARAAYQEYVLRRIGQDPPEPLSHSSEVGILGDSEFIAKMRDLCFADGKAGFDRELPQLNKLAKQPRLEDVRAESESYFGIRNRHSRRVAIYLSHKITMLPLKEIAAFYQIGISGVTEVCRKVRREIGQNETFAGIVAAIENQIREAQ